MNEAAEIRIAIVKEDDMEPVIIQAFNDEAGIEAISDLVSESGEVSYLDLSNINIPNVLLVIEGQPIKAKGGYNFSIQIYPIFGPAVFLQFGMDADGNAILVDMDDETLEIIKTFIKEQKEMEAESGMKDAVIADINKYGREGYIKRIDSMFSEGALEEAYERAKAETEQSKSER